MEFLRVVSALFFPERCPICGKLVEPCEVACAVCLEEMRLKRLPIMGGARGFRCVSSFVYDGRIRRLILRIKYQDRTQFIPQIAEILAEDIRKTYGENAFDLITAVPIHKYDQMKREYNQSELLAKSLGKLLGLPYKITLKKCKRTRKQHDLTYSERKKNLLGAFRLLDKESVKGKRILMIDDVITSGHTLGNCCRVLSHAKPAVVCCATIATARNKYPRSTAI